MGRMTITFDDEAWEWVYEYLVQLVERGLVVDVNGRTMELVALEADPDSRYGRADRLIFHPWNVDEDGPSPELESMPIFESDVFAIHAIHIY